MTTISVPTPIHVSPETVKRLARDVRQIRKNPLIADGIHYCHDEENMMKGYAMIIGPPDTMYEDGFYFFEIDYPVDYPASPPKLTFRTNQYNVRFNPNLYASGKVCLSLLNTWRGEQWTSCQTISSVLLTLCTVLGDDPLLNEPGVGRGHKDFVPYNNIIRFMNIRVAILNIVDKSDGVYVPMFDHFREQVVSHFMSHADSILARIQEISSTPDNTIYAQTSLYNMSFTLEYISLRDHFQTTYCAMQASQCQLNSTPATTDNKIDSQDT